jgi:hypothetical protein
MEPKPNVVTPEVKQKPRTRLVPPSPVLRFSPTAWAKLLFFCHHGNTEIGGFGITSADDLLCINDFQTIKQAVTGASVAFDDAAVADFFDQQVDAGRKPEQFARIWLHTHPGDSASPSSTDEDTFYRVFCSCQWAIMFILARGGKTFARLRFNTGPGGQIALPVEVDYRRPFAGSDLDAWKAEYKANIHEVAWFDLDDRLLLGLDAESDGFFYRDQEVLTESETEAFFASADDLEDMPW